MHIECEICKKGLKVINDLHLKTHNISVAEYKIKFPNAQLYNLETKEKMKAKSSLWHSSNKKTLSEATKEKIRQKAIGRKSGPRSEETKRKMRKAWEDNRESWCAGIKKAANKPEAIAQKRLIQQRVIEERGYHLARGKETKFESLARAFLQEEGYTVKTQKQSTEKICGAKRYFDIYVEELNLLIELDGEFWHRKPYRLEIDIGKTNYARLHNYNFLRLSDSFLKRNFKKEEFLKFIKLDQKEKNKLSDQVLIDRVSFIDK